MASMHSDNTSNILCIQTFLLVIFFVCLSKVLAIPQPCYSDNGMLRRPFVPSTPLFLSWEIALNIRDP